MSKTLKWFRKAADEGSADGMYRVGWAYEIGRGVAQDRAEALKWYRQAAEAGQPGMAALLLAKRIGPAFVAFAADKADDAAKKAAVAQVKEAQADFKALDLAAMGEVVTDFGISATATRLRKQGGGGAMLTLYDEMQAHYLQCFREANLEARSKSAAAFAACAEEATARWYDQKRYDNLVEFWRYNCAGMSIVHCTEGDVEPLLRLMNRFLTALLRSGLRKEAEQVLADTLKLCDDVFSQRPWDWFAQRAYVDLCFDTAATLTDLNDVPAAQPLLRRGFVERLKQSGMNEAKWLTDHAGKDLPLDRKVVHVDGKKFTVQATYDGAWYPVDVEVRERKIGMEYLRNQFSSLELVRRIIVPRDRQLSFERLFLIAQENNVSYVDLCIYALESVEKPPTTRK